MTVWLTNNEVLNRLNNSYSREEMIAFCKINAAFHQMLAEEEEVDPEQEYEFTYWLEKMEELKKLKNG